jgi:hypothetical protein
MPDDLTASASYFLASIQKNTDRATCADVFLAVSDLLPGHLRQTLDDAYDALALA